MSINFGRKKNDSLTIHFDGENYLVLSHQTTSWGEGKTLDDAYVSYSQKKLQKEQLTNLQSQQVDIGLIWLAYRKRILYVLVIFAIVYAQLAVISQIPLYIAHQLGDNQTDRLTVVIDKITDKVNSLSDGDREKISLSLSKLRTAFIRFPFVDKCGAPASDKKNN